MSIKLNFQINEHISNSESNDDDDLNEILINDINECKIMIDELYLKYNKNKYIQNKIKNYIVTTLPNTLNNLIVTNEKKSIEKIRRENNINEFISKFLTLHKYFYNSSSDIYFCYDNKNYTTIKEDTIISNINNYINKINKIDKINTYKENIDSKKQTNINEIYHMREKMKTIILKKIKDTHIYTYIPESETIQNIFSLLVPTFFSDKIMAKYFLVCLGDIILKKNNCVFLINSKSKNLIKLLSSYSYNYFGTSYFSDFKYKYHEMQKNCKIIQINSINNENLNNEFHKNILNLLCISIHYSIRFNNSNEFLENEGDYNLCNYVNLLCDNKLINHFVENNIEFIETSKNIISSKSMHFLWKDYLTSFNIPSIHFSTTIKNQLKYLNYNEENDYYYGIISKNLPVISNFLSFWEQYFEIINNLEIISLNNEFDVSEILSIYKINLISKCSINDDKILQILKHYYDNILIQDKNVLNIVCKLWDKHNDINNFLIFYKNKLIFNKEEYPQSLVCIYSEYINYGKKYMCLVNKNYFIKFLKNEYINYIEDDILLSSWWN